jgi:hypothetical protein
MDLHLYLLEALAKERLESARAEGARQALLASGGVTPRRGLAERCTACRNLLRRLSLATIAARPAPGSKPRKPAEAEAGTPAVGR